MKSLRSFFLSATLASVCAGAFADAQMCNDMYPVESYEAEERAALVQDCLAAYTPEPSYDEVSAADPAYYEGTVEDFVNEVPADEPPAQ